MAHFMRVLSSTKETPSIPELVRKIEDAGFLFRTFPTSEDPRYSEGDWKTLHLSYEENKMSINIDRSLKGGEDQVLEEDIAEFREHLEQVEGSPEAKAAVGDLLERTEQIHAVYVPDDLTEFGWELVEFVLETLLDAVDGSLQADGEGFFDKEGELLLAME